MIKHYNNTWNFYWKYNVPKNLKKNRAKTKSNFEVNLVLDIWQLFIFVILNIKNTNKILGSMPVLKKKCSMFAVFDEKSSNLFCFNWPRGMCKT